MVNSLLSWCVHRECLLVLEAGVIGCTGERKLRGDDLHDIPGMGSERKGRLLLFYYTAGDETGGVGFGQMRDMVKSAYPLPYVQTVHSLNLNESTS